MQFHWLIGGFILSGILFLSPGSWAASGAPAPDETFDFGRGPLGSHLRHQFYLANRSGTDLVIRQISTSCGCTKILSFPKRIKAGETGIIDVQINLNEPERKDVLITVAFDSGIPPRTFRIVGEVYVPPTPGVR